MGWLSNLFGNGSSAQDRKLLVLKGDGNYMFDVVGESHYQDELADICGGYSEEGSDKQCVAFLIPEPDNPYDASAVMVVVNDKKVAYLAAYNARRYLADLEKLGFSGATAQCQAMIRGGWDRGGGDVGDFGVKLNLRFPIETA